MSIPCCAICGEVGDQFCGEWRCVRCIAELDAECELEMSRRFCSCCDNEASDGSDYCSDRCEHDGIREIAADQWVAWEREHGEEAA